MSESANKKILVVDDEPLFVSSVVDALVSRGYPDVTTAGDGREALAQIAKNRFDLIMTDLNMPHVGGIELLAALSETDFRGRVLVVSAYLTDETERAVRQLGAVACLEKPIDLEALVELVESSLARPDSVLGGLTVAGFTQLLEIERKSCLLRVSSLGKRGDLLFEDGELIDAVTEEAQGDRAALDILSWHDAELQLHEGPKGQRRRITLPLNHLLLESARLMDESNAALESSFKATGLPIGSGTQELHDPTTQHKARKEHDMSNVKESLNELMDNEGAIGAALVDFESGMTLGAAGGGDKLNMDVAAAGNTRVVQAKMQVMESLDLDTTIEDILITLGTQFHLIRPLSAAPSLFLYLVLDRKKGNLAMARHKLSSVEAALVV